MSDSFRFRREMWTLMIENGERAAAPIRQSLKSVNDVAMFAFWYPGQRRKAVKMEFPRHMKLDAAPFASSRGIEITVERRVEAYQRKGDVVDRLCITQITGDDTMFEAFACNLIDLISDIDDPKGPVDELRNRIADWQDMLSRPPIKTPTVSEMVGMWGELVFLRDFMIPRFGAEAAVDAWLGPISNAKDFEHNRHAFEIKTTRDRNPTEISISSYRQLDLEGNKSLHLVLIKILEDSDGGMNLLEVFETIDRSLVTHPIAQNKFRRLVTGSGWTNESLLLQPANIRFRVDNREFFAVSDTFVSRYTKQDIRSGTRTYGYEVFLSNCRPHSKSETSVLKTVSEA
jgi:hypothetical protein